MKMGIAMKALTLAAVMILAVMLVCACGRDDQNSAMARAQEYWSALNSPGDIDAEQIAQLLKPFVNESGVKYLTLKLLSEKQGESQTAALLLAPMYDSLIRAKMERAESLLALIDASQYRQKAGEYSKTGDNAAIRYYLDVAVGEWNRAQEERTSKNPSRHD
jgi:hypothetical protein